MYQTPKMRAAMKGTRMRELRALGYTSDVFPSRFRGTCPASGIKYPVGEPVCFFTGYEKPILATIAAKIVEERRRAAAPKCGCGKEATVEPAERGVSGSPFTMCDRCDFVCEYFFETLGCNVTRDSMPILPPMASDGR